MTMRHDPYSSPWRWVALGLVLVLLVAFIAWGVASTERRSNSSPPDSTSSPAVTEQPTNVEPVNPPENDPELDRAILAFVEAYNLPASSTRNKLLEQLSTPDGYRMVYSEPNAQLKFYEDQGIEFTKEELELLSRKMGKDVVVEALPGDTSIQVEPFGDDMSVVSAYIIPTIRIERDGKVMNTLRLPGITTSWVKEADEWKFAHIQH